MVTSPINPMRYWKLEEIQRMLNKIEGYENVVIEFQYQQSDDWSKRKVWECRCGIKEQLVNGQYNWLLKYVFAIEAKDESDARTIAWQEAAERLVTDVWKNSIHSFRKQQRELDKPKAPTTLTEQDLKIIDEINEMENKTNNNTIQTNQNTTWTQIKLWSMSVLAVIAFLGCVYLMLINKTALFVFGITVGVSAIIGLVVGIKGLIEGACEEIKMSRK